MAEEGRRPRDPALLRPRLVKWIRERVEGAGLNGGVLGVSGGVDSAVLCGLAAEALGPERCLALILPMESPEDDARLAAEVADGFGVPSLCVDLERPFHVLIDTLADYKESAGRVRRRARGVEGSDTGADDGVRSAAGAARGPGADGVMGTSAASGSGSDASADVTDPAAIARANVKPRLRAIALYYFANLLGYMVLGTSNRDERAVGYFTKWGDGAADALPLGDLLKAEVRALAHDMGVPKEVVLRAPSAGLYPGQTDEGDLGFSYDALDTFLLTGSSGDSRVDERIRARMRDARHKLESPPLAHPD